MPPLCLDIVRTVLRRVTTSGSIFEIDPEVRRQTKLNEWPTSGHGEASVSDRLWVLVSIAWR